MNHQQTTDDSLLNMIHLDLKKKRILCTPKNYHCSAHHCPCSALTHLRLFCLSTILSSDGSGTQTWSSKLFGQYSTRTITSSYYPSCFKLFMNTFCTPISLFLGNPIQIGPIDNNKSPLSSPVLTKKLENTLDRIEDAFKSLPDRPRSASIGNMKKYNSPDLSSPLTISGFVLDKKLQRNASKFAIFFWNTKQ